MDVRTIKHQSARVPARRLFTLAILATALSGCGLIVRQATMAYIGVNANFAPRRVQIVLHRTFVERYKNRVQIHTDFTVDRAMSSPLPTSLDGDMHFTGRAPQIALTTVAEIANAADQKAAVDLVHAAEGTKKTLDVSGVWRIWPEHAGRAQEKQGAPLLVVDVDSPDHVFEIHPVTRIEQVELLNSFTTVKGFNPGDPERTLGIFQKVPCMLELKGQSISMVVETGLYNDVELVMQIAEGPQMVVDDGRFVTAAALDLSGKPLVPRLRMVFARGTPPEQIVRRLKPGDRLHVFGIPRVDLAEVSRRIAERASNPAGLTDSLPYEIIVLGVYPK